jgi:hypothetical protein
MARVITADTLGAWLVKCDPGSNPDLVRQVDEPGTHVVTRWCVADGYRGRMMAPGDRAVLWVSGDGRRLARGIWGVGRVTGEAIDRPGRHGRGVALEVALEIPLARRGTELPAAELVAAGITDLEVQRQPFMSNPSWVSTEQLARMEELLPPWPEDPAG